MWRAAFAALVALTDAAAISPDNVLAALERHEAFDFDEIAGHCRLFATDLEGLLDAEPPFMPQEDSAADTRYFGGAEGPGCTCNCTCN